MSTDSQRVSGKIIVRAKEGRNSSDSRTGSNSIAHGPNRSSSPFNGRISEVHLDSTSKDTENPRILKKPPPAREGQLASIRKTSQIPGSVRDDDNEHIGGHQHSVYQNRPPSPLPSHLQNREAKTTTEERPSAERSLRDEEGHNVLVAKRAMEEEKLRKELADLDCEIKQYEEEMQSLRAINATLEVDNNTAIREAEKENRLLEDRRRMLNASRAFATTESTLDAQSLIQTFEDINTSIADFAFEILRALPESADQQILRKEDYEAFVSSLLDQDIASAITMMAKYTDLTPMDITDPLVRHLVCAKVCSVIFEPFALGISTEQSKMWSEMFRNMQSRESQERCGHWRSITYAHAAHSQDDGSLAEATKEIVDNISKVVRGLCRADVNLPRDALEAVMAIFKLAQRFQQRAKADYISTDYIPFFPLPNSRFSASQMTIHQGGDQAARKAMLVAGIGLHAEKNVLGDDGRLSRDHDTVVKALVVADNWDPNV